MGPLAASTWVHECHGHPDPCSSLGQCTVHDFSLKKGNMPLGLVERTRELYGLAARNLESVKANPHKWEAGAPLGLAH